MKIEVYSHCFMVTDLSRSERTAVESYIRQNLVQYEMVVNEGRKEMIPTKEYASTDADKTYVRFHINFANEFLQAMAFHQVPKANIHVVRYSNDIDPRCRITLEVKNLPPPRGPQPEIIEHILAPGTNKIITLQTGLGKGNPLSTKIRIPGGWSTMGKMELGSTITAKDGSATEVTAIYPQGVKDVYKVTFADGRVAECDDTHLWRVYYINTVKHLRWRIVDTLEMKRLIGMPNPRVYVDLIDPEEGNTVEVPMDPYTLGILLGDGHFAKASVNVSTPDQFVLDELSKVLPANLTITHSSNYDYRIVRKSSGDGRNTYLDDIRMMGLSQLLSYEKFVPEIYLESSRSQRLALVQGLLDSDGTVGKRGSVQFCTTSLQLAKDLQYLIRSLGGIVKIASRNPHYTYNGEKLTGRVAYILGIRYKKQSELFRLPRKKERTNDNNQYAAEMKLKVISVEFDRREETQCISISHPDKLYVIDDFIVTHNTHIAKCCVNHLQLRSAFFMKSSFIDRWIPDMEDSFHFGKGEILEVAGSAALNSVMEMALEGDLAGKCIFFSINTFSDYLKAFERQGVSQMFPIAPIDFFHRMGFGFSVLDEGHQFPHQIMKLFSYTHVPKFVTLSATLDTQNKFNNRMYEIMYPRAQRFNAGFYDAFIVVTEILYQLKIPNSIRCSGFQGAYSHTAFEASLMLSKNRHILKNYLELIAFYVNKEFVSVYEKGQKGLVFCATIKFCTLVSSFLAKRFPQIDVQRYVSKDKPSVLANAEFIVSTVLSAGTAIDIPNLLWGFMTIALDSQQSNEQTLGRTRRLKGWADTDAKFAYLVCQGIPKHVQYSTNKKKFFQGKVKAHLTDMSPISV